MPLSRGELEERSFKLGLCFKPGAPISNKDLFFGRMSQIRDVVDSINQTGQHVVLYGERGVGKSSLANMIFPNLHCPTGQKITPLVNGMSSDKYADVWKRIFEEILVKADHDRLDFDKKTRKLLKEYTGPLATVISPDEVRRLLYELGREFLVVVILDEFDSIEDEETRVMMSDTIKFLSDRAVPATVLLIGVADDAEGLVANHQSVERCLQQISMPRMSRDELELIVTKGLATVEMTIDTPALQEISRLARGLPHYAHLLGLHSGRCALDSGSLKVTRGHVGEAVKTAINKAQATIQAAYSKATTSSRKDAIYKEVLLGCAMAETDDLGWFYARDAREPLRRILKKPTYGIEGFAKHLHAFCEETRGPVLKKDERQSRARYRFANPLVQPYTLIRGLAEELISEDDLRATRDKKDPQKRMF